MRHLLALFVSVSSLQAMAQWTGDPAAPMALCDATGSQTKLRVVPDGGDGWYAAWIDERGTHKEIWGQHVAATGDPLWEPNGRQLVALPGRHISDIALHRTGGGELMLAFIHSPNLSNGDTACVALLDGDGSPLWGTHRDLGGRYPGAPGSFGCHTITILDQGDGTFTLGWVQGGASGEVRMNRVDLAGIALLTYNGVAFSNTFGGPIRLIPDGAGGMYLIWRDQNGASPVKITRLSPSLATVWAAPITLTGNTFYFYPGSDGDGGLLLAFNPSQPGTDTDALVTRILPDGTFAWTPSVKPVVEMPGIQEATDLVRDGGHFFVVWQTSASGMQGSYLQKMDMDGEPLWPGNGMQVSGLAMSSGNYSKIAPLADGGAMVARQFSGSYYAARFLADGSQPWSSPTVITHVASLNPVNFDHLAFPSSDGSMVVFWRRMGNDLYGAKVDPSGVLVGPGMGTSALRADGVLHVWPVPVRDGMWVSLPPGMVTPVVRVCSADGRIVLDGMVSASAGVARLDVGPLHDGAYILFLSDGRRLWQQRFIKE